MNEPLETVLVSPMTTTLRRYPTRLNLTKIGQVALDHSWRSMASVWSAGWARFSTKTNEVSSVLLEIFVR
jgi:mRNA-degrading endonuclease toxin of MazEF toxin-antitoxin module